MPRAMGDGSGLVVKEVTRKVNGRTVTERRLFVRVRRRDEVTGKVRSKWRRVANRTEAKTVQQQLAAELRAQGGEPDDLAPKTFGDLAQLYAETSLVAAEYRDGRKIRGRRSLSNMPAHLRWLCAHFGAELVKGDKEKGEKDRWRGGLRLSSLSYDRLKGAREALFNSPVHVTEKNRKGRPRSVASVHRRLALLRNMLRVAVEKGYIERNPFSQGPPLINPADEAKRKRVLSYEEEDLLLAQCVSFTETRAGKPPRNVFRAHLRAIIVCALDTAMRQGEILKLRWPDVDAGVEGGGRRLTIQQANTKTLQERGAPVSKRLLAELERLRPVTGSRPDKLVFGVTSNVKRSFESACRDAGIRDLHFHDLRRTAATRLHREGMPIAEVSRILGHSSITTTYRYIGVDEETTDRAAAIMDDIEEKRRALRKQRMSRAS